MLGYLTERALERGNLLETDVKACVTLKILITCQHFRRCQRNICRRGFVEEVSSPAGRNK
jgi:hypothetical protein